MSGTAAPSGLVVVDKPGGITSHGVVARARRALGTRKIGHAGTLDPMATGVLVLGVGRATRLLGHLALTEKTYLATVRLGAATTTDDAEGELLEQRGADGVGEDTVRAAKAAYVGDIVQVPSAVSAIKVDGQRAYARVRAGEEVTLAGRPVTVHAFDVLATRREGAFLDLDVRVRCSSGTYIRALARDLGADLGTGGHLTALRREAVGALTLAQATLLDDLGPEALLPLEQVARSTFPAVDLDETAATDVRFGRRLAVPVPTDPTAVFAPDGTFLALYRPDGTGSRPVAVFV
ncbi:MAG: tRNA pseudouridine(55) synthase TruB [Nocardioides sp.]|nr:tRNA pseudouridine(55) synthase TruB [Nocardioides sp.]